MSVNLDAFLDSFYEESDEQLAALESGLLRLEETGPSPGAIDDLFRAAHTLKGNAATFGFRDLVSVTHRLETLLDQARERGGSLSSGAIECMLMATDAVSQMLTRLRAGQPLDAEVTARVVLALETVHPEDGASHSGQADAANAPCVPLDAAALGWHIDFTPHPSLMARGNDPLLILRTLESLGTLHVEADLSTLPSLDALDPAACYIGWRLRLEGDVPRDLVVEAFDWVSDDCDLVIAPLHGAPPVQDVPAVSAAPAPPPDAPAPPRRPAPSTVTPSEGAEDEVRIGGGDLSAVRIPVERVDRLVNLAGQLAVTRSVLERAVDGLEPSVRALLCDALDDLARHTRDLQDSVLKIRMLPLSFVTRRLPRVVRDLSRTLGKEVELRVVGEETELDKSVLEQMSDPLMHIVRNCLDHGMESPDARRAAGKPPRGTIEIRASHQQGRVVVEIADDGPGIDCDKVLAAAQRRGVPGVSDELSREQILELVFHPGLSTAEAVSEVSGRGVGLDVVRQNVFALGGTLHVESEPGAGTRFTMRLPLTLAIIDGQLVRAGGEILVVPLVSIVECLPVDDRAFRSMGGRKGLYRFRDEYVPVARLDHLLELEGAAAQEGRIALVVEWGSQRKVLLVDALLEHQQVVVKSLDRNFRDIDGIIGGTILGDGSVGLIIDVAGLMRKKGTTPELRLSHALGEGSGASARNVMPSPTSEMRAFLR